ncbi:MAG: excinuclease ABC subunit UvrC, partial [SAR202 cluster bacterium]|nr:excinuclease ABC subunit UvrC [SAR202 cluster bacterium]
MINLSHSKKTFQNRLNLIPNNPGVYVMKDIHGKVIYVGKASNLKNRVSSYFNKTNSNDLKLNLLRENINDFEIYITNTNNEALLLESSLIKKYQPKFNIRLKDDKSYPYIMIDLNQDYPIIQFTRNITIKNLDRIRLFGPFSKAKEVRKTLSIINALFPYRSCTKKITGNDLRPCLDYHLKRCIAPCISACTKEEYEEVMKDVVKFLEGDHKFVINKLNQEMVYASENMMYERAARIRDQIQSINEFHNLSKDKINDNKVIDYIGITPSEDFASVSVFESRFSNLSDSIKFIMEGTKNRSLKDIIHAFINQYYLEKVNKPNIVVLQELPEIKFINDSINNNTKKKMKFIVPSIGIKKKLMDLAIENSEYNIEHITKKKNDTDNVLNTLKEKLLLEKAPERIECFDISNIQGKNSVGSMVVFYNGQPDKKQYRRFKIKIENKVDDYLMMKEMLTRRYSRLLKNNNSSDKDNDMNKYKPDLILIDGGKGHLTTGLQVLLELGLSALPIASIAKKHEYIYIPYSKEPINISPKSSEGMLLQNIRDEAHRFAIQYHRKLRSKGLLNNSLNDIHGLGIKTINNLLLKYGTINNIKHTNIDDLILVRG